MPEDFLFLLSGRWGGEIFLSSQLLETFLGSRAGGPETFSAFGPREKDFGAVAIKGSETGLQLSLESKDS